MNNDKSIDGLSYNSAKKNATKASNSSHNNALKKVPHKPTNSTRIKASSTTTKKISTTNIQVNKSTTPKTESTKTSQVSEEQTQSTSREDAVADFLKPVQAFDFDGITGNLKASTSPIKVEKESPIKKSRSEKKLNKKRPSKARRIITIIALVIVLGLGGVIIWGVTWGNDIIAKITGGQGNVLDLIKFIEPTYDPLKTDANGRTNILAFGTSGYNMAGDEGDGVHDGAQLTDSIMMISLNQDTGDIAMLSLPRDLKSSPTCTATGKINEVYWCNGGKADADTEQEKSAATALMTEVGSILGVEFQYFAHLNWGSLVSIVDTLGGINITLDEDINDAWWTGAVYEAGVTYTLNGEEALGLARARHGTTGGDFTRGASQQKILIGIKDKIFEKDLSITDIISLASTLGDNFRSNFSIDELKSAAHLTFDFNFDSMRQISLWPDFMTTGSIDGVSYVLPRDGASNYGTIQEYVSTHLSNDPRVYEAPVIAVLNASGEAGLASAETTKLTEAGYTIATTDNTPEGTVFTDNVTVYYKDDKPGSKNLLKDQYKNANFQPISNAPEALDHNYDFIIILGPTPTQSDPDLESTQQDTPPSAVNQQ